MQSQSFPVNPGVFPGKKLCVLVFRWNIFNNCSKITMKSDHTSERRYDNILIGKEFLL